MNYVILTLNMPMSRKLLYSTTIASSLSRQILAKKMQLNESKAKYSHCYEFCMPGI